MDNPARNISMVFFTSPLKKDNRLFGMKKEKKSPHYIAWPLNDGGFEILYFPMDERVLLSLCSTDVCYDGDILSM